MSVFSKYEEKAYPYRFEGSLHVPVIVGGIPSDPKVAEGWLRSKLQASDDMIRQAVAATMIERDLTADDAMKIVDEQKHLNGFKRDKNGLYIEGRQLKAALKEAGSVAVNSGKLKGTGWGKTNKTFIKWVPEHVFVIEEKLPLGVTEPTGINQRFVHTWRGSGIQYEEYVEDAKIDFTVITDHDLAAEEWAMIWLTGQQQGIGATRSQGYGRYEVTRWEKVK
jgi:hypothetical protein